MEDAELAVLLAEVRERVRARYPQTADGKVPLADLTPLVHARDAALGKVAAIGSVNPRSGGPLNALLQGWKKLVARVLDWHVREQVVFNRNVIASLDAAIEALADTNRSLAATAAQSAAALAETRQALHSLADAAGARLSAIEIFTQEMRDMRTHWANWRADWERKLQENEVQFLRSVADLQAGYTHRADLMDANYRGITRGQHQEFMAAMDRQNMEIQQRLWADLDKVKLDYERLIHTELRLIRQRLQSATAPERPAAPAAAAAVELENFDSARFAERFRGSEARIKAEAAFYVDHFRDCAEVLDIGCGRGEFLELLRESGVPAKGIDLSQECVSACLQKGLQAEAADLFPYLSALPEQSLGGIFCSQVVEHLSPSRLPELVRLCATRLERGGILAFETPNPECLAIFATHFYLDPTHIRPVPAPLLAFYMAENGVGVKELRKLAPAQDTMPSLAELPPAFREAFFGGLDYAIIGVKL